MKLPARRQTTAELMAGTRHRTGIDLERLIAARAIVAAALPGEPLYGHVPDAGLTKGFRYAAAKKAAA